MRATSSIRKQVHSLILRMLYHDSIKLDALLYTRNAAS